MVWFVDFELKYPRVLVPTGMIFYTEWNGREWVSSYFVSDKDGAKIVVIKRWPVKSWDFAAGAKHRFMFRSVERMRGGIRLFKEGDIWIRRLPYATIEYKTILDRPGITPYGYIVLERTENGDYRVTSKKEFDAILRTIEHSVHSRTCNADLRVEIVKGEGHVWCDSTSTTLDSVAACLVIAKPGSVLEITKETGPYRGECDTIVEKKQLVFDKEQRKTVLRDYEDVEENEIV